MKNVRLLSIYVQPLLNLPDYNFQIHDLLKIFVSEKLDAYQKFYDSHREFVTGLGLKHESNMVRNPDSFR